MRLFYAHIDIYNLGGYLAGRRVTEISVDTEKPAQWCAGRETILRIEKKICTNKTEKIEKGRGRYFNPELENIKS